MRHESHTHGGTSLSVDRWLDTRSLIDKSVEAKTIENSRCYQNSLEISVNDINHIRLKGNNFTRKFANVKNNHDYDHDAILFESGKFIHTLCFVLCGKKRKGNKPKRRKETFFPANQVVLLWNAKAFVKHDARCSSSCCRVSHVHGLKLVETDKEIHFIVIKRSCVFFFAILQNDA